MNSRYYWLCLLVLLGLLAGCATTQNMELPQTLTGGAVIPEAVERVEAAEQAKHLKRIEALPVLSRRGTKYPASDVVQNLHLPKGGLLLNADGLALNQFIQLALGDVLQLTFEVDEVVAGRTDPITLRVSKPMPAERLLAMVEETLDLFEVALVRGEHNLRVVPKSKLEQLPATLSDKAAKLRHGQIAEVIPLQYVEMSELQLVIGSIFQMGKYGRTEFNNRLNAVIVIGDADRVARLREFIDFLDRPAFNHHQLRLVRPVYWQSKDLAKQLTQLLKVQGIPVSDRVEDHHSMIVLDIDPIKAMLVSTSNSVWMGEAEALIERLDGPEAAGPDIKTFIYFTRYRPADELGSLISSALGSGPQVNQQSEVPAKDSATPAKDTAANKAPATVNQGQDLNLDVVVDAKRNALIFMGTSSAYQKVVPILDVLDIQPRQVLIEVTVADVTLDDSNQLGVDWQLANIDNSSALTGTLGTLGGLGVGAAGLTYALADKLGNVRAKLSALASKGRAKILSSPVLLAMDGEKAHMQVGTQISVLTQEVTNVQASTATGASLLRSFQYLDTGVILNISPTITEFGSIRMELNQEVSEPGAGGGNQPPIFKRSIETVMMAESGQTLLLGGLITHNNSVTRTQVPLLGDLPIVGALFRNETITDRSTELIILITPHVINNRPEADRLTKLYRKRLGW